MSFHAPSVDATYREYADLQLRRHYLLAGGKADDPQVEETENRLSELWEKLDEAQRLSLNGMSSDLNWVRRGGTLPPKGTTQKDVTPQMRAELEAVIAREDWHELLHQMRLCAPALRPECLAHNRGLCYRDLRFPQLGAV